MLIQNIPQAGYAGAAPTFTMSDAPVYQPILRQVNHSLNRKPMKACEAINAHFPSCSQHSNYTNSTNVSSHASSEKQPGTDVFLDIEKVQNTYYMNANRRLVSSFVSSGLRHCGVSQDEPISDRSHFGPKIRVSLNQTCCFPGDSIIGTVFCDLFDESVENPAFEIVQEEVEVVKLLVTLYGIEKSTIVQENGEIFCKERDIVQKTVEVASFSQSVKMGMHNFDFSFKLPDDVPPSCSIHSCNLGKTGGVGAITYSVVATLQGGTGTVSFQGNGNLIVKALRNEQQELTTPEETGCTANETRSVAARNSKILRYLSPTQSQVGMKTSGNKSKSPTSRNSSYVSLESDEVPLDGKIMLNVNLGKVKQRFVKAKKLSVKLLRIIELHTNEYHQRWENTLFEQSYDVKRNIEIELSEVERMGNVLRSSVESRLIVNKYVVQVRVKSSFGVLRGCNPIVLPIKLYSDESLDALNEECNGICNAIKYMIHLKPIAKPSWLENRVASTDDEEENSVDEPQRETQDFLEDQLLFVENKETRDIIKTRLVAVEIAKQQLREAKDRADEAEKELRETIKTLTFPPQ